MTVYVVSYQLTLDGRVDDWHPERRGDYYRVLVGVDEAAAALFRVVGLPDGVVGSVPQRDAAFVQDAADRRAGILVAAADFRYAHATDQVRGMEVRYGPLDRGRCFADLAILPPACLASEELAATALAGIDLAWECV